MAKYNWVLALFTLLGSLLAVNEARAQIPGTFLYEGYLEESSAPVTGARNMSFALFAAQTGGSALWNEPATSVPVTDGYFTVVIGDGTAIDPAILLNAPWLEVTIGGTALGRQALLAVPFALQAATVDWADVANKPAGFSDNVDDVSSGSGGGTVTSIGAGPGLTATVNPITVNGTISVDFGPGNAQVARGDHNHDSLYSVLSHAHSGYALTAHNHDSAYAPFAHNHDGAYAPSAHLHDAAAINAGMLSADRYSAVADLAAEGQLDNNAGTDLLTRAQSDGRYVQPNTAVNFTDLTASNLSLAFPPIVANPLLKTMSWWAGESCWERETSPSGPAAKIGQLVNNTKLACVSTPGLVAPEVRIFLSGVPDRISIKEWGMFVGQGGGAGPDWTCELKKDHIEATNIDQLIWPNLTTSNWEYRIDRTGLNLMVDNALGNNNRVPWQVRCTAGAANPKGRYFLGVFIRYTEQ